MARSKSDPNADITRGVARNQAADACDTLRVIQTHALARGRVLELTGAQTEALHRAVEALRDFDRASLGC